ncbi:Polygalacturonase ADPG1 [Hordeum vulgare]|nr:Polygalacturonase ADPG1 [Hordeum vulgare]
MRAEADSQRLRHKNTKALQHTIELLEREANKEAATKKRAACHANEQDRLLCKLSGRRSNSDSDLMDVSIFSSDGGAPPHVDAYMKEGHKRADDRKGKGSARKW